MKSSFFILLSLFFIVTLIESGCSVYPAPAQKSGTITSRENNSRNAQNETQKKAGNERGGLISAKTNEIITANEKPCRLQYYKLNSKDRNIRVEGKLSNGGNTYPVVLDTGASQPIFLDAALVRKNNLPLLASESGTVDLNGHTLGFCLLPELNLGEIVLSNWSCIYLEPHTAFNVFGIPVASSTYSSDNIIIGLPLLCEFKYIKLNSINNEAELSYHESFEPADTEVWEKYPISIEEDFHGNKFLFVNFSIAGRETELQLDTGSGRGLAISETTWNEIENKVNSIHLKKGKDYYPYIGNLTCKRGTAPGLEFGNRIIKDAEVSVFQDDSPLLAGCDGLVGMQYFTDTVIVLDFEHDLMWLSTSKI